MLLHKLVPLLFSLAGLTYSAPLTCEQLSQPTEQVDLSRLEGTWVLVAGTYLPFQDRFRHRDSAFINFPANKSVTNISYSRGFSIGDKCVYGSANITLNGSNFTFDGTPASNLSGVFLFLTSCPDCLIMSFNAKSGRQRTHLLFSQRRELEQHQIQEFNEQVQCLQMPPPTIMDPTKNLCPWPQEASTGPD
ncbi:hypothetical protein WMY93_006356 [Mugilogobius chulae]|uniref:Apolipoprotein M n=1 Tax=Mugilogobius chulae TaxID=88201 RepID=A0AAW0PMA0_9GOBI